LVKNFLGASSVKTVYDGLKTALASRDAAEVIRQFNKFLAKVPYDDYSGASLQSARALEESGRDFGEFFYRACLFSLLHGAGLRVLTEVHGSLGRTDLVVELAKAIWVMELKVSRSGEAEKALLQKARDQIIEKQYAAPYDDPIVLGIVINDEMRAITQWAEFGDWRLENRPTQQPR
jgi:hypothetical protein